MIHPTSVKKAKSALGKVDADRESSNAPFETASVDFRSHMRLTTLISILSMCDLQFPDFIADIPFIPPISIHQQKLRSHLQFFPIHNILTETIGK